MADPSPLRAYRAACPGCGAPVEFRSAQSTHAICGYCHSTVVRDGDVLRRVGKMGELFEDHSPLQLQASGVATLADKQRAFTLVGRLQYKSPTGTWTEWNALFDDGSTATLGEDNGAYVLTLPAAMQRPVPGAAQFRVGSTTAISGKPFSVTANDSVSLIAAQGELARLPALGQPFAMVELRSADGEVFSIDYSLQPPGLSRGRAVRLEDLRLSGLRDEFVKEERGRQFNCPNCGATVEVTLANSRSITCGSCHSLIDLSAGTGAALGHALQDEPVAPLIALGSVGQLQGVHWQVVGFQHRMGHDPQEEDAEHFGWDEYLLYHPKRGFSFLVDSQDGWSMVKPTTGAPVMQPGAQTATYLGTTYRLKESYQAETGYVAGEFYWPVQRGQKTFNRDFAKGRALLSMEQTPGEITWSSGSTMDSDVVAKAFRLEDKQDLLKRGDAAPTSAASGVGCLTVVVLFLIILVFLLMLRGCMGSGTGTGFRTGGGSFGGYSSGGGHK